jgi:hypothetical protein
MMVGKVHPRRLMERLFDLDKDLLSVEISAFGDFL